MNPESNKELLEEFEALYVKDGEIPCLHTHGEETRVSPKNIKAFINQHFISRSAIKEWAESMKQEKPKGKCMNLENHTFGNCFQCVKIDGYNQALQDLLTFLSNKG